jgi:hemolysin III
MYLLVSATGVVLFPDCLTLISPEGVQWLKYGVAAYLAGLVFFGLDPWLRYGHLLWHLFALMGTASHFVAVLHYSR